MNPYQRFAGRFGATRAFAWLGRTLIRPYDSYARGKWTPSSTLGLSFQLLYLTTTGRRSGQPRTVPLLGVQTEDGGAVVIGTNWGGPSHPDWVYNLQADPNAVLERDGMTTEVRARSVSEDEFEQYWNRFVALFPAYDAYRTRTDRRFEMFVLSGS